MYKCGIMGGTFDPIHLGHLVTAEAALHEYGLDSIHFVPSGKPPHKDDITDSEHRYLMTLLATVANPHFYVSRMEIDRTGYSFTYDTVLHFAKQHAECEIYFITGADVMGHLHQWHRYQDLLQCCQFVAATRPGFDFTDSRSLTPREMSSIKFLEVPSLAISSTDIRERVQTARPIRYLVPSTVEGYIYKHGLYGSQTS